MDSNLIASIHLSTAVLLALFILLMKLENGFLKRMAIGSLLLFITALLIAAIAGSMSELKVSSIEIITLSQGALSSMAAVSYGLMLGVSLNFLKTYLLNSFRKMRSSGQ